MPIGGLFWTIAYLLIFLKGMKDKYYGMPLVPMAFNFTWELIHSFIYPSNGISLYFNISWFLLDLGIVFTYFKYSFKSFNNLYSIKKVHWLGLSIFTFCIAFLLNLYGELFFSELQNKITKEPLYAEVLVGFIVFLLIPTCMIVRLFQQNDSKGQSFLIAFCLTISIIFYTLEISFNPFHHQWGNTFMMTLMASCVIFQLYYTFLIYNKLIEEGSNPWKINI